MIPADGRPPLDDLLARLRARASDPERRVDAPPTVFSSSVMSTDLGQLMRALSGAGGDVRRVVAANQAGAFDQEMAARADRIAADMSTSAVGDLPRGADPAVLDRAERELGFALPPIVRRVYGEVADGGFGPGPGLMAIESVVGAYRELAASVPVGRAWPERLLPVVHHDPSYACIDATSPASPVVRWDPEELTEFSSESAWRRSFSEVAPSLDAWLEGWLSSRPPAEQFDDLLAAAVSPAAQIEQARQARATIGAMTPQERAAMGLPDVGWERVVWGGLGLDEDEPPAGP